MLHRSIPKVAKFQLPAPKRFSIVDKSILVGHHPPPPPMSNWLKLSHLPRKWRIWPAMIPMKVQVGPIHPAKQNVHIIQCRNIIEVNVTEKSTSYGLSILIYCIIHFCDVIYRIRFLAIDGFYPVGTLLCIFAVALLFLILVDLLKMIQPNSKSILIQCKFCWTCPLHLLQVPLVISQNSESSMFLKSLQFMIKFLSEC